MSANNCYIILPYKGTYYGWDEMAEESMIDDQNGGKRILSVSKSRYSGKSLKDVYRAMAAKDMFAPEYGIVSELDPTLPKDGTPVEVRE